MSERPGIDEIVRDLPRGIGRLLRLLSRLSGGELPRAMASALAALADGPQHVGELAVLEGVSQPTVTRLIGRLEEQGYVERVRDRVDRRLVVVTITDHGRAALERYRARQVAVLRRSLGDLSDAELSALVATIDTLAMVADRLRAEHDA
jgi:DNA-binding MarR family transcriptional regulator